MKTRLLSAALALCLSLSLLPVGTLAAQNFYDLPPSHWAHAAVQRICDKGLMNGTGGGAFSPEGTTTRAMIWTVLARSAGMDTNGGATWYEKGRLWAMLSGISDGTDPEGLITREQLAAMLYRYEGSPEAYGSLTGFTDGWLVSPYAQSAVNWAVSTGLLSGMGDGTLAPQGSATRAQVAVMLDRYQNLEAAPEPEPDPMPEPEPEPPAPEPPEPEPPAPEPEPDPGPDPSPVVEPSTSAMVANLRNSRLAKRETLAHIGQVLLEDGFEPAFVAGCLGNIILEGACGLFESSNYDRNPDRKPGYLQYMDETYQYREKYSYQYIYEGISLWEIDGILEELGTAGANGRGSCFGLGCMQWTHYNRIGLLVDKYLEEANGEEFLTKEQCFKAEGEMISHELQNSYKRVHTDWQKDNSVTNSLAAAYKAGVIVCTRYGIPVGYNTEAVQTKRGNSGLDVYEIMLGID